MLVLLRKKNESVVINGNIIVQVNRIRGDRVVLGIEAPEGVPVHRREVQDEIDRGAGKRVARGNGIVTPPGDQDVATGRDETQGKEQAA